MNNESGKYKKILVIEDEQDVVEQIKMTLYAHFDCTVDATYNGKEGIDKLKEGECYDLVILAVLIPALNGIEVCHAMMEDDQLKGIPVLLISVLPLSSRAFQKSRQKFKELALVREVLEKPFTDKALLKKVKTILEIPSSEALDSDEKMYHIQTYTPSINDRSKDYKH